MGEILSQVQALWPLLMEAPWAFALFGCALLGIGWATGRFMFGERIEVLKARLEKRDEDLRALQARIEAAPSKAEVPTEAVDAIYQYGGIVAHAVLPHINRADGHVTFQAIEDAGDFNPNDEFVFRGWKLKMSSVGGESKVQFAGRLQKRSLQTVTAKINGRV